MSSDKPVLLVFGDGGIDSGAARILEQLLRRLAATWSVHHCAVHWTGDAPYPSEAPYPIYRADIAGGDPLGLRRYQPLITHLQPACVLLVGELWDVRRYVDLHMKLPKWPMAEQVPLVAYVPVRGSFLTDAVYLNDCTLVLTNSDYGAKEFEANGYKGPCVVLPPGVDTDIYQPHDRNEARAHFGLEVLAKPDIWIVGNNHRNVPHQRLDVCLMGFAQWVHDAGLHDNAYLWLQCANKGEGWDLQQLARQLGVEGNLLMPPAEQARFTRGMAEAERPWLYSAWDVCLSTSLGSGWGQHILEVQACGVPCVAPDWGVIRDWPSVCPIPVTMPLIEPTHGTVGGLVHPQAVAHELHELFCHGASEREVRRCEGLAHARDGQHWWAHVAGRLDGILHAVIDGCVHEVAKI